MTYLLGIVVVLLFFGVMHFFTELNAKQKIYATTMVSLFVVGAIFYNFLQAQESAHVKSVMLQFNQGKNLNCQGLSINKINYTLSIGTQVFIAKKESDYAGKMVSASECE